MMLALLPINEYAAKLASKEPAPGGGSAAAVSGLLGISLLEMVINLSHGRPDFAEHDEFLADKQVELVQLHGRIQQMIDRDAEAFRGVMTAFSLPKSTDTEKTARTEAVQQSMQQAAEVPLIIAAVCIEALEIAVSLLGKVNAHAVSDLMIGAMKCQAGAHAALLNTLINVPYLKDGSLVNRLNVQVVECRDKSDELFKQVAAAIYAQPTFAIMRSE